MAELVKMVGLDFGTTTSSVVIAAAQLRRTATGRVELDCQEEIYRSDMVFTPLLADDRLDRGQLVRSHVELQIACTALGHVGTEC